MRSRRGLTILCKAELVGLESETQTVKVTTCNRWYKIIFVHFASRVKAKEVHRVHRSSVCLSVRLSNFIRLITEIIGPIVFKLCMC